MENKAKKRRTSGILFLIAGLILILSNAFSHFFAKGANTSTAMFVIGISFLVIGTAIIRKSAD